MANSSMDIRPNRGLKKLLENITDQDMKMFGSLAIEASRDESPVATGTLKRSLKAESPNPRVVILKSDTGYGGYVHFGTKRQVANPYMARGIVSASVRFERIINQRKDYKA